MRRQLPELPSPHANLKVIKLLRGDQDQGVYKINTLCKLTLASGNRPLHSKLLVIRLGNKEMI